MATKRQIMSRLDVYSDETIIAVPTIKTKQDVEDLYEYANDEQIELTDEQWKNIVRQYEKSPVDDEELVELVESVVKQ